MARYQPGSNTEALRKLSKWRITTPGFRTMLAKWYGKRHGLANLRYGSWLTYYRDNRQAILEELWFGPEEGT